MDGPLLIWVSWGVGLRTKAGGGGHTADQDQIARETEQLCNCVYYGSGGSEKAEAAPWQKAVPVMGKSDREGRPC